MRSLTSIHVASSMVGATKSSPPSSTSDVTSSAPTSDIGRWGHFIMHGASHAKARVVWLKENAEEWGSPHLQIIQIPTHSQRGQT